METKLTMRTVDAIHWLWTLSSKCHFRLLISVFYGTARIITSLTFIWLCKRLIDIATRHTKGEIGTTLLFLIVCVLFQILLSALASRVTAGTDNRLRNDLRHSLMRHLLKSRWSGREKFHSGDVLNRLETDVDTVTTLLSTTVPSTIITIIQLAAATVFLALLDVRLAFILFFVMPVALLFSKVYMKKMRRFTQNIRTLDSRLQSRMQESLQNRLLIATMERVPGVMNSISSLLSSLKKLILQRNAFSIFSNAMVQAGFAAGYLTAFVWGVYGLRSGTVTFGMLTAFLQLVAQIQRPALGFSQQIPAFINALTSVERLRELTTIPLEEEGQPERLQSPCGVRIDNLTFAYPDSHQPVLKQFSYNFRPGSMTAILGETGSGKSTLVRLILALLSPQSGQITLYDANEAFKASPLTRCNFSYVPQGNSLISGTLRENLLLGNPAADDDQLWKALHTAAAGFVDELPDGLDTPCGEKGSGFSEGQAQRIAIARGLLRTGSILLLDEPTSALDAGTEARLLENLSREVTNKTVIIITHLNQTARLCTSTLHLKHD